MHSTVLNENASLLSSHAIGNFLFPTYDEVLFMSMLNSFLLKITVNSGLWMLMLSLNHFIGNFHLGPPQILSLVQTCDDTHPKPVLINIPSHQFWEQDIFRCYLYRSVCVWLCTNIYIYIHYTYIVFLWLSGRALCLQRKRSRVQFPGNTHADKKCIASMHCKSLWIKASTKCKCKY